VSLICITFSFGVVGGFVGVVWHMENAQEANSKGQV